MKKNILIMIVIIICALISFLIIAGIVKLGSLIFGYPFSWILSLFIWLVDCLLQSIFNKKNLKRFL